MHGTHRLLFSRLPSVLLSQDINEVDGSIYWCSWIPVALGEGGGTRPSVTRSFCLVVCVIFNNILRCVPCDGMEHVRSGRGEGRV